ncbi:hypothetical protein [Rheinheimera pleomorphica]|uniref:hypothetical protein n=1 Tax=Rheinheimera pleomorphica TaxID=2703963 RepID=UPI00141DB68F|nr:hypothetical protein [Rheinheimera pleomorphica]
MTLLLRYEPPFTTPINCGLIELDIDPAAERYVVMDRINLTVLWHGVPPAVGNAKIRLPLSYTIENNLMALILDDAGSPSYYVNGNDKIQASLVDARTVQLNP